MSICSASANGVNKKTRLKIKQDVVSDPRGINLADDIIGVSVKKVTS